VTGSTRQNRCDRTRAWAALAPDGELAVLERRLLEAHLGHCEVCRDFAVRVAEVSADLRAAAAERPARRFVLPAAKVRRSAAIRVRGVASMVAVAAMTLGIAVQAPFVSDGRRPVAPRDFAPAEVDDAKLHTLRLLRQEALLRRATYPDRPSGPFGSQPA
jgi:predicted anti-sigma-YlaC factor YlaD